jgi:uncharacterized protein with PIN domain
MMDCPYFVDGERCNGKLNLVQYTKDPFDDSGTCTDIAWRHETFRCTVCGQVFMRKWHWRRAEVQDGKQ